MHLSAMVNIEVRRESQLKGGSICNREDTPILWTSFCDSIADMPLGLNTRTADIRRIDYILYKPNDGSITLVKISVPDGRAQCPQQLEDDGGTFLACPALPEKSLRSEFFAPEEQDVYSLEIYP